MKPTMILFLFLFLSNIGISQTTWYVDDDAPNDPGSGTQSDPFLKIQYGIDAASDGDTVLVLPGTYVERIDFGPGGNPKSITVASDRGPADTIIDGSQSGSVVTFQSGEGPGSVLDGFTITNGLAGEGGGVICLGSDATILNNMITENTAQGSGGGIFCYGTSNALEIRNNIIATNHVTNGAGGGISSFEAFPVIANNIISGNTASNEGGGIVCFDTTSPTITNNLIVENEANIGGGIHCEGSYPTITNNTITNNTAIASGGGIYCSSRYVPTVSNTILWTNIAPVGPEISIGPANSNSTLTISRSDVQGGQSSVNVETGCTLNWGPGMINAVPSFVDSPNDDYHLTWNSPCRDAGDNSFVTEQYDFEGDPRIVQNRVDIGADQYYYHLYHVGAVIPGSPIALKIVGFPTAPITLYLGSGTVDPPYSTQHGDFWLNWPPLWKGQIGTAPGNGVLVYSATVPTGWTSGSEHPLQALVGPWGGPFTWLTNAEVLAVD